MIFFFLLVCEVSKQAIASDPLRVISGGDGGHQTLGLEICSLGYLSHYLTGPEVWCGGSLLKTLGFKVQDPSTA